MRKIAKLPENCDKELLTLLRKHQVSYHKELKIRRIKNAFISYEGLVMKHFLLVIGCAFNLIGFRDKTFYFQFWKLTLEKYLVSKFGKSIPAIYVDETVAVIHSKWFNYAFWINSYLPRLLELIDSKQEFKLLYPEHWDNIPYVKLVVDELPIEFIRVPQDHQVFAKKLLLPQTRKWTASFDSKRINLVREQLIKIANEKLPESNFPKKIYLTRKNRGNRCAENEVEVMQLLSSHGFEAIAFEDYTIWDQIKMMSEAIHFISIHGAGLTNLIFLNEGAQVLELVNRQYAQKEYTFPFWKLAQSINLKYNIQLCDAINQFGDIGYGSGNDQRNENDFLVNSNLIVDINRLKSNI
jgi:hypothetical protein